jgi:hypothetical protein
MIYSVCGCGLRVRVRFSVSFFLRTIDNTTNRIYLYVQAITKTIQTIPGNACERQPGPIYMYSRVIVYSQEERISSTREGRREEKRRENTRARARARKRMRKRQG